MEGEAPLFASMLVDTISQEKESLGVVNPSGGEALLGSSLGMGRSTEQFSQTLHPIGSRFSSSSPVNIDVPLGDIQLTTIDLSLLRSQLGICLGDRNMIQQPQTHHNPLPVTRPPNSSLQNDDADDCPTALIEVTSSSPPLPPPTISPTVIATAACTSRSKHYKTEENTITNICTSNIILDLPQVTTRLRTRAIKPQPPPAPDPLPNPPTVSKIVIKQRKLPSGVVWMTVASPSQPPPLQMMKSTPFQSQVQQVVHAQVPPPRQAKPQAASPATPPLQIKVPSSHQPTIRTSAAESPSSGLIVQVGQLAGEEVAEAEDGIEVEVNVAAVQSLTPVASLNICVRSGCTNPAVESKDWDYEYCSNECVATHCRDVFMAWCTNRRQNSTTVA